MYNKITENIIGAAIEVHKALGPGLLESAYQECLLYELKALGYSVRKEVVQPVICKHKKLDHGYRIDLLVENSIVLELKTVENLTYMKLGNYLLGLLLNFKTKLLKNGIKRFINTIE
ncbi:GxxExxY protein [Jejuia pallidilutea]|uniref:GxxExxY protein n=1 Tax=Jejuia pallidilutea TaxID=504487 RepID=A0A362X6P7_9FLAO|nr:GxxExxY protein [Jejuia pallidilutea]PQV51113.1 GxxExxY protein [Jejuia pallidilutea]